MKKIMTSPISNVRKTYQTPRMKVSGTDIENALLAGSGTNLDIIDKDKEEWPSDPGTNQPIKPW